MGTNRLVVVGLDSMVKDLVAGWAGEGVQPRFRALMSGFPDFGCLHTGGASFIERKPAEKRNRKNGGLSDVQVECHAVLEAVGCQVATCYKVEEVEVNGTLCALLPLKGRVAA